MKAKIKHTNLAQSISEKFQRYPQVEAIALGGSQTSGTIDQHSDIDLYIFITKEIPLMERKRIVDEMGSSRQDLGLTFWDSGDEWFHRVSGIEVDIIFWDPAWIEDQIDRILIRHQASVGYTTCFWHTIKHSKSLFDRNQWLTALQKKCDIPYPTQLKKNIIEKNFPVLRQVIPSFYNQIKKAIDRGDIMSIQHRVTALLSSYFDVLFSINELTHPGEKKILAYAFQRCSKLPLNLSQHIEDVLFAAAANPQVLLAKLDMLIEGIETIIREEDIKITV